MSCSTKIRPLRARADQAHVALEHAEELRQLVDAGHPHEAAHARDAVVAGGGPARLAVFLGVLPHAAELHDLEGLAVLAHAFLPVEHRAAAVELDDQCGQQHDRRGQDQQAGAEDVEGPLDRRAPGALIEAFAEDQPAGIDEVDADLAQAILEVRVEVVDLHAVELAVEQLPQRHAAGSPLGQRDHDLVDLAI